MNCDEAAKLWSPARDGQLEHHRQAELEAHLARCPACRQRVADDDRLDLAIGVAVMAAAIAVAPAEPLHPWWSALAHPPTSAQLRWFALVASLVLLAFFSMAGLGLRHPFHQAPTPSAQGAPGSLPDAGR